MNTEHLEYLIATILAPFTEAVMHTKEELVLLRGQGSDILPTFSAYRTADHRNVIGSCSVIENRFTGVQEGHTRWMNLCRQVTRLTEADTALVAVEIVADEPPVETLELSMVTPESVTTTLRPYRYLDTYHLDWLGQATPGEDDLNRGGCIEIEGARHGFHRCEVAYPASIRYLSDLCGCTWTGHPALLDRIGCN